MFIVDARSGLMPDDIEIAKYLRSKKKLTFLIANKVDGINIDQAISGFWSLGFNNIYPIAASHKYGISDLLDKILLPFVNKINPLKENSTEKSEDDCNNQNFPIKLAIVGCPNVGKSTLINRILGKERMIVYDEPGTTRENIYIPIQRNGRKYVLIDTAGIRKRTKVTQLIEKFSVIRSLYAIENANVVVLVIDAYKGITNQDLSLLNFILDNGRALVIVVNKWDGINQSEKKIIKKMLSSRLRFINFVYIHFISSLHGRNINSLFKIIRKTYDSTVMRINSSTLTRIVSIATKNYQTPFLNGRRARLKYAHIGGYNPLIIVIHGTHVNSLSNSYKCYLLNFFYKSLNIIGTPIRLQFKE